MILSRDGRPPLRRFLPLARSLNALFGVALVLLEPWLNRRRVHSTSPVREAVAWLGCPGACSGVATRRASVHYGVRPSAFLTSSTLVVRPPLLHEEWRPGLFALSATVLVETYARFRGPWTEQHEQDYRTLRARFAGAPPPAPAAADDADYARYDELRLARLCKHLQRREPDASAGYSIQIFRLTAADLRTALEGPVGPTYRLRVP